MRRSFLFLLLTLTAIARAQEFSVASGLDRMPGPVVAAGTREVLILWRDADSHLVARRFGLDGVPLDAAPIAIANSATGRVSVAFDGLRYLIAWVDVQGSRARVAAVFLSANGAVSEEIVLFDAEWEPYLTPKVAVAWNGVDFIVVWSDSHVRAAYLDGGGTVDIAGPLQSIVDVTVAAGGDRDLIAYTARSSSYEVTINAQLIDRSLNVHATTRLGGVQGSNWGCNGSVTFRAPSAVWTGSEWAVGWISSSCRFGESVVTSRLTREGEVLEKRVVTPYTLATATAKMLMLGSEPVLLTQLDDRISGIHGSPLDLHRLSRNEPPRRLLSGIGTFTAAAAGTRLVIAYENSYLAHVEAGWRVDARVVDVDLPPATRRRAVR